MKILAVDDHPIFRKGLVALIQGEYTDAVILEAEDGMEAINLMEGEKFDVVILDIDMPEKSGIDVLDHIRKKKFKSKNVILTMHNDELFFNEAFNRGANGFLLKEDSSMEIIECIEKVQLGVPFVSQKMKPFLENRNQFNKEINRIKEALESLTNAEVNTLKLVSQNKTSKEIASLLFVTEKSVENYRSRICKKLDISGGSNSLYKWCVTHKELIK
ncbi:MAG: response regulator transcription factor [Crocinitomicaceae bacterium]